MTIKLRKWKYPSGTKLYYCWRNMRRRCYDDKDASWKHYGGRGIGVCSLWYDSYDAFYEWAIISGFKEGLSLDRMNVNGHYLASNCRWSTNIEQHNNERRNVTFTHNGVTKTLTEWARHLGLSPNTCQKRHSSYGKTNFKEVFKNGRLNAAKA